MSKSSPSSGKNKYKKVDISSSCLELADYLRQFSGDIDNNLIKSGQAQLAFFFDPNYTDSFQNLASLKKDLLLLAAEDIAKGVNTLRSSVLGISFIHSKLKTYVIPHGSAPEGSVVFSISWKNIRSFQNWRAGDTGDIDQNDINACLYLISFELSKLKINT
jgi:hypothetical protein